MQIKRESLRVCLRESKGGCAAAGRGIWQQQKAPEMMGGVGDDDDDGEVIGLQLGGREGSEEQG